MKPVNKHIILTDDDPGVQDAFRTALERAGYTVTVFANGAPLLEGRFETPDLFLLDKQLSGVDGLDICRHLKADARTAAVPIIMLSATPQIDRLAKAAGADGFLEKPFRLKQLMDAITHHLEAWVAA